MNINVLKIESFNQSKAVAGWKIILIITQENTEQVIFNNKDISTIVIEANIGMFNTSRWQDKLRNMMKLVNGSKEQLEM